MLCFILTVQVSRVFPWVKLACVFCAVCSRLVSQLGYLLRQTFHLLILIPDLGSY